MNLGVLILALALTSQPPANIPSFTRPAPPTVPAGKVIPGLVKALGDADLTVRLNAGLALAEIGPAAVAPLTEALRDKNRDRRAAAAYALGQLGTVAQPAVPDLMRALEDDDRLVRRQAALAVGRVVARSREEHGKPAAPVEGPTPTFPAPGRGGR